MNRSYRGAWALILAAMAGCCGVDNGRNPEAQRAALCLENGGEMAIALAMYAQDYDEQLPPANPWMDLIRPYTRTDSVFHCPSAISYGYAHNSPMSGASLASINTPEEAVLAFDSTKLTRNASDAMTSLTSPPRHLGRNTFIFADGRASAR